MRFEASFWKRSMKMSESLWIYLCIYTMMMRYCLILVWCCCCCCCCIVTTARWWPNHLWEIFEQIAWIAIEWPNWEWKLALESWILEDHKWAERSGFLSKIYLSICVNERLWWGVWGSPKNKRYCNQSNQPMQCTIGYKCCYSIMIMTIYEMRRGRYDGIDVLLDEWVNHLLRDDFCKIWTEGSPLSLLLLIYCSSWFLNSWSIIMIIKRYCPFDLIWFLSKRTDCDLIWWCVAALFVVVVAAIVIQSHVACVNVSCSHELWRPLIVMIYVWYLG